MRNLAWDKFLDDIRDVQQELGCKEPGCLEVACRHLWYRGHADGAKYKLLPSLFRPPYGVPEEASLEKTGEIFDDLLKKEKSLFRKYEQAAIALGAEHKGKSAWEMLFEMQHYYIPTRLLDWTSVLGVAVFFAVIKEMKEDACVYVLNPHALNKKATRGSEIMNQASEGFDYRKMYLEHGGPIPPGLPIAIEPSFQNRRILAQKGKFTCHNDSVSPLEEQCEAFVRKVALPKEARTGAEEFLSQAGINSFSIFPDMDGLAPFLRTELDIR